MMLSYHFYHLVSLRIWPFMCGLLSLGLITRVVYMFKFFRSVPLLIILLLLRLISFLWWRDVSREGALLGDHTLKVQDGLKWGMFLFILREGLFFIAWFWAFFHARVAPIIEIGMLWPPLIVSPLNPFSVPLLNTAILLSSGVMVTWAHHNIQKNRNVFLPLLLTLALGFMFTFFQVFEYINREFSISDRIFGTTFFVSTGFHGLHVIIGALFLRVCIFRFVNIEISISHHLGFEFSIWYWHFVDVIWLFLFSFIYWWGYF